MIDAAGGMLAIALRLMAYTATTGALGAWAFARLVLPRVTDAVHPADRSAWQVLVQRTALWCAVAVSISAVARYVLLPAASGPDQSSVAFLFESVRQTLGLRAQAIAAGMTALFLLRSSATGRWPVVADIGVMAMGLLPPALSHAGSATELQLVAYAVDVVHGAAAGAWVGALALVTIIVHHTRRADDYVTPTTALFAAYHPVAVFAAPTVFLTGLVTAWLRMGVPEGIASPAYSGLFVVKVLLVGVTGYIGLGHSALATKRGVRVSPHDVTRTLFVECGFALAVLCVTAVLVGTPPIG